MSAGKSSGSQTYVPTLSPEQNAMISAQTDLFTKTIGPSYQNAVKGATDVYNTNAPSVQAAATNLAGTSQQAQNVLGTTGETALKTGVGGLTSLFTPDYEQQQLDAVLKPAQAQYEQNVAGMNATFGGAGQLGSYRNALAAQQLAGMNQMNQQAAAAQVENNIAQQRLAAGGALVNAGQSGIAGAQTAAQNQISAAMSPQALYNQYATVLFGTPSTSYNPNFAGTQGHTTTESKGSLGFSI